MTASADKKGYAARWFDHGDFTPEHDEIFLRLLNQWKDLVMTDAWPIVNGTITGEPSLDGYPPIFPDAIATGTRAADHRHAQLQLGYRTKEYGPLAICGAVPDRMVQFSLVCPECRNEKRLDIGADASIILGRPRLEAEDHPTYDAAVLSALPGWVATQQWRTICQGPVFNVVFEIKPKIDSLGSVMRQLNLYRERSCATTVVLITADHRFDAAFREQGYRVVDVDPHGWRPAAK